MAKTFLYRLFGLGKIPPALAETLQREHILVQDEGFRGSTTYLNFRAPGRIAGWRRVWFTSSITVTDLRLVALEYASFIINVPFTDERMRKMQFSLADSDTLLVAFDANLFRADWSGKIEYRFNTPQAQTVLNEIQTKLATS